MFAFFYRFWFLPPVLVFLVAGIVGFGVEAVSKESGVFAGMATVLLGAACMLVMYLRMPYQE